uniref:Uncharacterized protein n=1 Tax=candidate division WOR-3 bacterium TaxID=2052148 RepID=A0A7V4E2S9_UNCW3
MKKKKKNKRDEELERIEEEEIMGFVEDETLRELNEMLEGGKYAIQESIEQAPPGYLPIDVMLKIYRPEAREFIEKEIDTYGIKSAVLSQYNRYAKEFGEPELTPEEFIDGFKPFIVAYLFSHRDHESVAIRYVPRPMLLSEYISLIKKHRIKVEDYKTLSDFLFAFIEKTFEAKRKEKEIAITSDVMEAVFLESKYTGEFKDKKIPDALTDLISNAVFKGEERKEKIIPEDVEKRIINKTLKDIGIFRRPFSIVATIHDDKIRWSLIWKPVREKRVRPRTVILLLSTYPNTTIQKYFNFMFLPPRYKIEKKEERLTPIAVDVALFYFFITRFHPGIKYFIDELRLEDELGYPYKDKRFMPIANYWLNIEGAERFKFKHFEMFKISTEHRALDRAVDDMREQFDKALDSISGIKGFVKERYIFEIPSVFIRTLTRYYGLINLGEVQRKEYADTFSDLLKKYDVIQVKKDGEYFYVEELKKERELTPEEKDIFLLKRAPTVSVGNKLYYITFYKKLKSDENLTEIMDWLKRRKIRPELTLEELKDLRDKSPEEFGKIMNSILYEASIDRERQGKALFTLVHHFFAKGVVSSEIERMIKEFMVGIVKTHPEIPIKEKKIATTIIERGEPQEKEEMLNIAIHEPGGIFPPSLITMTEAIEEIAGIEEFDEIEEEYLTERVPTIRVKKLNTDDWIVESEKEIV